MKLKDNKYIPKVVLKKLKADGWTISKLATTHPSRLTIYTGIGTTTARRIIDEARAMMNEAAVKEIEAEKQPEWAPGDQPLPQPEDPPMSARLKRIRGLQ
jgi:hypothetical protein